MNAKTVELMRDVMRASLCSEYVTSASFDGARVSIRTMQAFEVYVSPTGRGGICRVKGVDLLNTKVRVKYANATLPDILTAIDAVMDW
jgi:hypothetical protein